jgi:hypothetical protein
MEILTRLNNLAGKHGLLPVRCGVECFKAEFTFLSVNPAEGPPTETDAYAFQDAVSNCQFTVRFDNGTLINGSGTAVISGRHISRIMDSRQRRIQ